MSAAAPWPRVGAFSYDFERGELDALIDGFRRHGLTAVQLGRGLLDEALDDPARIAPMRAALAANGIEVVGLAGYRNLVAVDANVRREGIAFLRRCLEVAAEFGQPVVATETGTRNAASDWQSDPANASDETWALLDEALGELLVVAERHGAILALEGYVNNVLATADQLAALLERFPSPHLAVVLDPFNYLSRDLLPEKERFVSGFLDRFADRFVIAHLKDVSAEGAESATPEFGQGVFPHRVYLDFLRTRRPDLPIILEHLPFAHVPAAIRLIHAIAGEMPA